MPFNYCHGHDLNSKELGKDSDLARNISVPPSITSSEAWMSATRIASHMRG